MTGGPVRPKLDLAMPVHNEGRAIERTLREDWTRTRGRVKSVSEPIS